MKLQLAMPKAVITFKKKFCVSSDKSLFRYENLYRATRFEQGKRCRRKETWRWTNTRQNPLMRSTRAVFLFPPTQGQLDPRHHHQRTMSTSPRSGVISRCLTCPTWNMSSAVHHIVQNQDVVPEIIASGPLILKCHHYGRAEWRPRWMPTPRSFPAHGVPEFLRQTTITKSNVRTDEDNNMKLALCDD